MYEIGTEHIEILIWKLFQMPLLPPPANVDCFIPKALIFFLCVHIKWIHKPNTWVGGGMFTPVR
jgi:hypothetical protein